MVHTPYCCLYKEEEELEVTTIDGNMLCNMQLQKKWNIIQKQPSCKKFVCPLRIPLWKRCEIQGGSEEMAVMSKNFNNDNSGVFGAES